MRILSHGMKSLLRRPIKTVMLFVIFFIVFNLVFTGFIIENSVEESKNYVRNQMGAVVEYRMDFAAVMTNQGVTGGVMSPPALSLSVAERVAANRYVLNYFITDNANANSDEIQPANTQQTGGGFQRNASDFILAGSNQVVPLDLVMGKVTLVDGNLLSQQNVENGDYVIVISQDVAKKNNLRVGDSISLSGAAMGIFGRPGQNNTTKINTSASEYAVIGLYEALEDGYNVNTMFTSLPVTSQINNTGNSDDTSATIVYLLDNPDHVEAFKQEASPYLTSEYHSLYSNDNEYESLTRPLNLISFITSILIWVVFIAGAAIILAIVTIFVRDRKFEIGLLLSSGESKMGIVKQFIIEIVVVAIIAFGISVGTSHIASKSVSNWIVENQLLAETSLIGSTSDTMTVNNFSRGQMGRFGSSSIYGDVNMENVAAEFDVSLSAAVMRNLLLFSLLLVLAGASIPLSVILSYNPKRILQDY